MYVDRRSTSGAKDPAAERLARKVAYLNAVLARGVPCVQGPVPASEMQLEPGPVACYDRHFPGRSIVWDWGRQLWVIWQDGQVADMVFYWWAEDPDSHLALTETEVAELVAEDTPTARLKLRKQFRPFNWYFVTERLRIRQLVHQVGNAGVVRGVQARNRARQKQHARAVAGESAAFLADIRRWIPAVGTGYLHNRIPQVPVGVELRAAS